MRIFTSCILFFCLSLLFCPQTEAFWVWTPETNKWVNPKYTVKATPGEQLEEARELLGAGDYEGAIQECRKLLKHYPKSREAAEAQFIIAESRFLQFDLVQAYKDFQIIIERYPFNERSAQIVRRQFEIGNMLMEGRHKRNKVINTLVGGDYDVIGIFRTVIRNAPYGEYAAEAQYKIGLYLQEKDMFQEARDEFEKTINDYPRSKWAEAAKYQIALSDAKRSAGAQYNQAVTRAAVEEFQDFVQENPQAELSQEAQGEIRRLKEKEAENLFVIAEFYEKQEQYEAARIYYSSVVDQFPNTSWVSEALNKVRELSRKK